MRRLHLIVAVVLACCGSERDPGLGSVARVLERVNGVCRLGAKIERSAHGELWNEAWTCTPAFQDVAAGTSCEARLTKFPGRRAVMGVEILCFDVRVPVEVSQVGLLAQALHVEVGGAALEAITGDPNPRQAVRLTWSDGRTFLHFSRDISGHVDFGVSIDTTRTPRFELREGVEATGL